MGAFVDRSVHCIIKLDGQTPIAGAYPIGRPYFCAPKKSLLISQVGMKKHVSRGYPEGIKTWLICNHLDTPEKFISSYIKHHYFVVFDSHVFCHDCHEENMRDGEPAFLRMELAATALTDDELQQRIFEPFYNLNLRYDSHRGIRGRAADPLPWRVCHHLSNEKSFRRHVFDGNLILFAENSVSCPDCLDSMLKKSSASSDDSVVLLPGHEFQYAIVDMLYSVNYELSLAQGFIQ